MSALDKLFGRGNVVYHIAVVEAMDSVAAAIFAEQIAFWQDRSDDGWVFRTVQEIQEYTGLKKKAQQSARKALLDSGVLQEENRGMPRRNYYHLDLEKLAHLIEQKSPLVGRKVPTSGPKGAHRSIEGGESEKESSVLSTAEGSAPAMEEGGNGQVKPISMGQFFNKELADRIRAKREAGATIHSPTEREKRDFGAQFKALSESDGHEVEQLLSALDFQVSKAAGEIEGEPAAWCGFRTALDAVLAVRPSPEGNGQEIHPHSEEANKMRDKPRRIDWYMSIHRLTEGEVSGLLDMCDTHTAIEAAIAEGDY